MEPIPEDEALDAGAEGAHYATRRAKALDAEQRVVAQIEAQKKADEVLARYDALDAKSAKASKTLTRLLEDKARASVHAPDAEVPLTVRKDHLESAALADLIIEQHAQLKRAQVRNIAI